MTHHEKESIYEFEVKTIDGRLKKMSDYEGKTLLVVNTASKCGLTPQYKGLEDLYLQYVEKNFLVLGFPCNQFAAQEPGDENEIQSFCSLQYSVTFPMFSKIDVNGKNAHPMYQFLKKQDKGFLGTEFIKWNFTKFLVDKMGNVVARYAPTDTPASISKDIEKIL